MTISGINDTYSKLISSIINNKTRTVDNTTDSSSENSGNNNASDTLELNSSLADLSPYLNYSSGGNFSSLSLTDFLNDNKDSGDNDLLGSSSVLSETGDCFGSGSSNYLNEENFILSAFEDLADVKTKEIDESISKALEKMKGTEKKDG